MSLTFCHRKEFLDLMEKYGLPRRSSPTELLADLSAGGLSSGSSSKSSSPSLFCPKGTVTNYPGNPALEPSFQATTNDSMFQIITVSKGTGLGLSIVGGINRDEGPLVYILEVIPGGDCHKDGRLRPGDQLVSINKESLIGVTHEEARDLLHSSKMRSDYSWEIAFVRQETVHSHVENMQPTFGLLPSVGCSQQRNPQTSRLPLTPDEHIAAKMSILSLKKAGFKERDKSSTVPANNTGDVTAGAAGPTWSDDYGPQRRKISLNPSVRLQADKLEMALNYLGIQPTKEQQEVLQQQLPKDSKGTVSFGDFVQVARSLFCLQLDGTGDAHGLTRAVARLLDSQFVLHDPLEMEEVEELRREKNEALKEVHKLKEKLTESERLRQQLTEELQTTKQEAKASVEESRALRSRIHLAEAAQTQARRMEMDYEEVIGLLEVEMAKLKAQLANHGGQNKDSVQDLRKRITVLDCQLRKSETAKKTFEVATGKLLQFVEVVHEALSDNFTSQPNLSDRKASFSSKMLLARLGKNGRTITASLATEARELAKSVRAILEADCLPYGWEEAYTADGIKYFINHEDRNLISAE
ncbi:syntaxin-binding protein 4 isoform X2 [Sphaerodactylus townsendi]|uniref:syntaxin-binding protein 4 isoform X2 n=1 Tax=Sphaerodactylus townsendi TaxID=933632 RepID=UPI002026EDBA|nr:syntaxin-binding protein 4 isoform X2 [Sphaerodactylus townsendi]